MPLDPFAPEPLDDAGRKSSKLAELERRVAALERGAPTIQVGAGAPSTSGRDGTPYLQDQGAAFPPAILWLRVGGTWRSVALE